MTENKNNFMTVKDLIKHLECLPQNALVFTSGVDSRDWRIQTKIPLEQSMIAVHGYNAKNPDELYSSIIRAASELGDDMSKLKVIQL